MAFFVSQETGMEKARRLSKPRLFSALSTHMQKHVSRILNVGKVPKHMADVLEEEGASFHVCRWVAWGKKSQDRAVRLALALVLRRPANPLAPSKSNASGWAWPKDHILSAGEKAFLDTPQCKRLVKAGVLVTPGSIPHAAMFSAMWAESWERLRTECATLDDAFRKRVLEVANARKKKYVRRKRKLRPEQQAVIDALNLAVHAVARGAIAIDDLSVQTFLQTPVKLPKDTPSQVQKKPLTTTSRST